MAAFKNGMSKVVMMNAKAFFDLVHPTWESTVLQLKSEEQDYVNKENYAAAGEVAMRIEEIQCNTPESLKKGLMDAEPCGAVNAQCDELVGKIASVSRMSRKDVYERAYKRLRKP